ncbi:MAG: glycosyltransferase [Desulfovibrio sp.]|jgi:glycosyltransferase involved in cell wall biosynthesis|nr:glycosyltransferase [Desulfovibrio sp.]
MSETARRAKTVYISQWFPLSSETFVFYEVEHLCAGGFPVSAVSLYGRRDRELSPRLLHSGIPTEHLGLAALPRLCAAFAATLLRRPRVSAGILKDILLRRWRDLEQRAENAWAGLCGFYLARRFTEQGVEHVHAAWASGPATAAWVVTRLTGIPFSFSCHAGDIFPPDGALAEKAAAASFARTIAVRNIAQLDAHEPDAPEKHHLIRAAGTVAADGPAATVRMTPPLRLLAIGRLVEMKGFAYALEAVKLLKERGVQCNFVLAGSGPLEKILRRTASDLGVECSTHFYGFVTHDRIPELIRASDILLMPSVVLRENGKSDALPTVIVEAMRLGLPVIAADVAGIGEVVRQGETGLLVPQRDAAALADAVILMASDRGKTMRMAEAARALTAEIFDTERNMRKLAGLFCEHALKRESAAVRSGTRPPGQCGTVP